MDDDVLIPLSYIELALLRYGLRAWSAQFQDGAPDAMKLDDKLAAYWNRHVKVGNQAPSPLEIRDRVTDQDDTQLGGPGGQADEREARA